MSQEEGAGEISEGENADRVSDDETLYRSVWQQAQYFVKDADNNLRLSSGAFDDPAKEISLFRHHLCDDPPYSCPPRLRPDDVVVALLPNRIRAEKITTGPGEIFGLDVFPDPGNGQHVSHSVVRFVPSKDIGKKVFYKLKKRLTEIVEETWPIMPDPLFIDSLPVRGDE